MSKKEIQFQKGLSLAELISRYGTEEQCLSALYRFRWPKGFLCPNCGHFKHCHIRYRKVYQCNNCHRQTSVISGTIFASTKLPLTVWFLGIYFVSQAKNGISSLELSRLLGISANAALRMKHKLQQVMKERDDSKPLKGLILLDDAYWGGKKRDGKRGRGATGKMPFVAALKITPDGHPVYMKFHNVKQFSKKEIASWGAKHIASGSMVVSDGLGCFNGIRDITARHEAIPTGGEDGYDAFKVFTWLDTVIGNVKNAIHGTYRSVSSKHLPRYLAEFNYRFNRRFQLKELVDRLVYVALRTPPMPRRLLTLAENRW